MFHTDNSISRTRASAPPQTPRITVPVRQPSLPADPVRPLVNPPSTPIGAGGDGGGDGVVDGEDGAAAGADGKGAGRGGAF